MERGKMSSSGRGGKSKAPQHPQDIFALGTKSTVVVSRDQEKRNIHKPSSSGVERKREGTSTFGAAPPTKRSRIGSPAEAVGGTSLEVDPVDLVPNVLQALDTHNSDKLLGLLTGSIRLLKSQRSKPDPILCMSMLYLCKIRPNMFAHDVVTQSLCTLLKREQGAAFKSKGNPLVFVLACNMLYAGHRDSNNWPDTFIKVYIEDALNERWWVECSWCKCLVENIATAFSTKTPPPHLIPSDSALAAGGTMSPSGSGSPLMGSTDDDPDNTDLEYTVFPRYSSSYETVEALVLEAIKEQIQRRAAPDAIGKGFLKLLSATCGFPEIRMISASRLEAWLHSGKLWRAAQELLAYVCCNADACGPTAARDHEVLAQLARMRLKTKPLQQAYQACLREMVSDSPALLRSVVTHTIYNELSNVRSPNNMAVLAALIQAQPQAVPAAMADTYQRNLKLCPPPWRTRTRYCIHTHTHTHTKPPYYTHNELSNVRSPNNMTVLAALMQAQPQAVPAAMADTYQVLYTHTHTHTHKTPVLHTQRAVQRALPQQHDGAGRAHASATSSCARRHGGHVPGTVYTHTHTHTKPPYYTHNELSNVRSPNNTAVLAALIQAQPQAVPAAMADTYQELVLRQEDYLRPLRALSRECVRAARADAQALVPLARALATPPPHEPPAEIRERAFNSIADLFCCLCLVTASHSKHIPEYRQQLCVIQCCALGWLLDTAAAVYRPQRHDFQLALNKDTNIPEYRQQLCVIQCCALGWLLGTAAAMYRPQRHDFQLALNKIMFVEPADTYSKPDNWPPESERALTYRLCCETPLPQNTLLRVIFIGLAKEIPVGPAETFELVEQLVRRACALPPDDTPLPVDKLELADYVFQLCQFTPPDNITLPPGSTFELVEQLVRRACALPPDDTPLPVDKLELADYVFQLCQFTPPDNITLPPGSPRLRPTTGRHSPTRGQFAAPAPYHRTTLPYPWTSWNWPTTCSNCASSPRLTTSRYHQGKYTPYLKHIRSTFELVEQLVRRACALPPDDTPLPVDKLELADYVFQLCQFTPPDNITLPPGYTAPPLAITSLYWRGWILLVMLAAHNPGGFAERAAATYPTLRALIETCITRMDPAGDAGGAQPRRVRRARRRHLPHAAGAHRDLHHQVSTLLYEQPLYWRGWILLVMLAAHNPGGFAERAAATYPTLRALIETCITSKPSVEWSNSAAEAERLEAERAAVLQLETHLAAASNAKLPITEHNSRLLSQLTTLEPLGPARKPPASILESLQQSSQALRLGRLLCRQPALLLELVERHGTRRAMPWLHQLLRHDQLELSVLPVQCLCEFLSAGGAGGEAGKAGELAAHLRRTVASSEEGARAVLQYYTQRLAHSHAPTRAQANRGLKLVLTQAEDTAEMDYNAEVGPEEWLELLVQLRHWDAVRDEVLARLRAACLAECVPRHLAAYIAFLAEHADTLPPLVLDLSQVVMERQVVIGGVLPPAEPRAVPDRLQHRTLHAITSIFYTHLRKARISGGLPLASGEEWGSGGAAAGELLTLQWSAAAAAVPAVVAHAHYKLLCYGPSAYDTNQEMYSWLESVWVGEPPTAFAADGTTASLLPDWLRLHLVRSARPALLELGLRALPAHKLALFIQTFGMPRSACSALLAALDSCPTAAVLRLGVERGYMAQLLQVQRARGCTGGEAFAAALRLLPPSYPPDDTLFVEEPLPSEDEDECAPIPLVIQPEQVPALLTTAFCGGTYPGDLDVAFTELNAVSTCTQGIYSLVIQPEQVPALLTTAFCGGTYPGDLDVAFTELNAVSTCTQGIYSLVIQPEQVPALLTTAFCGGTYPGDLDVAFTELNAVSTCTQGIYSLVIQPEQVPALLTTAFCGGTYPGDLDVAFTELNAVSTCTQGIYSLVIQPEQVPALLTTAFCGGTYPGDLDVAFTELNAVSTCTQGIYSLVIQPEQVPALLTTAFCGGTYPGDLDVAFTELNAKITEEVKKLRENVPTECPYIQRVTTFLQAADSNVLRGMIGASHAAVLLRSLTLARWEPLREVSDLHPVRVPDCDCTVLRGMAGASHAAVLLRSLTLARWEPLREPTYSRVPDCDCTVLRGMAGASHAAVLLRSLTLARWEPLREPTYSRVPDCDCTVLRGMAGASHAAVLLRSLTLARWEPLREPTYSHVPDCDCTVLRGMAGASHAAVLLRSLTLARWEPLREVCSNLLKQFKCPAGPVANLLTQLAAPERRAARTVPHLPQRYEATKEQLIAALEAATPNTLEAIGNRIIETQDTRVVVDVISTLLENNQQGAYETEVKVEVGAEPAAPHVLARRGLGCGLLLDWISELQRETLGPQPERQMRLMFRSGSAAWRPLLVTLLAHRASWRTLHTCLSTLLQPNGGWAASGVLDFAETLMGSERVWQGRDRAAPKHQAPCHLHRLTHPQLEVLIKYIMEEASEAGPDLDSMRRRIEARLPLALRCAPDPPSLLAAAAAAEPLLLLLLYMKVPKIRQLLMESAERPLTTCPLEGAEPYQQVAASSTSATDRVSHTLLTALAHPNKEHGKEANFKTWRLEAGVRSLWARVGGAGARALPLAGALLRGAVPAPARAHLLSALELLPDHELQRPDTSEEVQNILECFVQMAAAGGRERDRDSALQHRVAALMRRVAAHSPPRTHGSLSALGEEPGAAPASAAPPPQALMALQRRDPPDDLHIYIQEIDQWGSRRGGAWGGPAAATTLLRAVAPLCAEPGSLARAAALGLLTKLLPAVPDPTPGLDAIMECLDSSLPEVAQSVIDKLPELVVGMQEYAARVLLKVFDLGVRSRLPVETSLARSVAAINLQRGC
ncbi:integrator complex subunit 1 [Cydia amplana]|uniref:integrator complex subunit 1 n=1 Tax=Cydia amplana TaxID=1869771 RepID=UPI002FE63A61